jgi:hypothetical protein
MFSAGAHQSSSNRSMGTRWRVMLVVCCALALGLLAGCTLPVRFPQPALAEPMISAQFIATEGGGQVTVSGLGWQPAAPVFLNLRMPDGDLESTLAVAEPQSDGQFSNSFAFPTDIRWRGLPSVLILARSSDGRQQASTTLLLPVVVQTPTLTTTQTITATVIITPIITTPVGTPIIATVTAPVTVVESPPPTATRDPWVAQATSPRVNVRAGPSISYAVLTTVSADTPFLVLGQNAEGSWLLIRLNNGVEGWISRPYTNFTGNAPLAPTPPAPIVITTPTVMSPTTTPLPPTPLITEWRGEYYANNTLAGPPALVRNDREITFDWGRSAPAVGMPEDNFSVRWTHSLEFQRGTYRFTIRMDDGMRLFVDDRLLIDEWSAGSVREASAEIGLSDGVHHLRVEYFENGSEAVAQLRWVRLDGQTPLPEWRGEYFANRDLQGQPVVVRNAPMIDFDWGTQAPVAGLPNDNFSVRWTRVGVFSGVYGFRVRADDGVRVAIDNTWVINEWHDNDASELFAVDVPLSGPHQVTVEYYERAGGARIRFWWQRLDATPTNTPVPATNTPVPPTNTSLPTATNTPAPPTLTPVPGATNTPANDQPTLQLQPTSGRVGDTITLTGQGFPPNTPIGLYLAKPGQRADRARFATTQSDAAGNIRISFELPTRGPDGERLRPGAVEVLAIPARGGIRGVARFRVTPSQR